MVVARTCMGISVSRGFLCRTPSFNPAHVGLGCQSMGKVLYRQEVHERRLNLVGSPARGGHAWRIRRTHDDRHEGQVWQLSRPFVVRCLKLESALVINYNSD